MSARILFARNRQHSVVYSIKDLPRDFKRVLRMQMKEFLHYLDESVDEPVRTVEEAIQRKHIA
jgi:hypothetical protein